MNVLVTGGAGYIGSHVCKALAARGIVPVTFDDLRTGYRELVRWGPFVEGDIGDGFAVQRALAHYEIQAILHFAASTNVGESVENPRAYFHNNVTGSLRLLDASMEAGVRCFVFSSSCAVYGLPEATPITEDAPQLPVNPYGHSKLFTERALAAYEKAYGLRWATLRYFNAAGADDAGETGELHRPETHLIPLAIAAAMGDRGPLELFGVDYPTPDGTAVRDYVHVSDLAQAHVAMLSHLLAGGPSCALNLGTGRGYSVRQVLETVGRVSGRAVPVIARGRRAGDSPSLIADSSKAAHLLAWRPVQSDIEILVACAHRWYVRTRQTGK